MNHIWVIESLEGDGKWYPCSEAWITRKEARFSLKDWQQVYDESKFRIRKYIRFLGYK